jgi:two-component system, cell cycle sensor histidine kinase and response regulator CckA
MLNHTRIAEGTSDSGAFLDSQPMPALEEGALLGCARSPLLHGVAETILFVEDEVFVREVAGEILSSAGYRVLRARCSEEALATYRECGGQVDLLLTDIVLPGENGDALAKKLRRENPKILILFVTGYIEQMNRWGYAEDGEEYLPKPFSAEALLQRVNRLLARKKEAR